MDWYGVTRDWCQVHDLVMNRVKVANQIAEGSCEVRQRGARYTLLLWGSVVAEWKAYDLDAVRLAFGVAEGIERTCWHSRRLGYAVF